MPFKKSDIEKLENLTPEQKADISALFGEIEQRDTRITQMTKDRADADKVVEKAGQLEKTVKEKDDLISQLNEKLKAASIPPVQAADTSLWGFFAPIYDALDFIRED